MGWWVGEGVLLLLLLTVPSPQVRWGWGDVAVMQVVADLSPPYCTPPPPGHPGRGGREECTADQD